VAGATIVIALTAMLVNAEPGRTALARLPAGPLRTSARYDTGGAHGTGSLDVELAPARPGTNRIAVLVVGADGRARDVPELDAELSLPQRRLGPLRIALIHAGPGRYTADGQIPLPGDWQLALTVRTGEFDESTVRIPVTVR
jgi:copper transport protein